MKTCTRCGQLKPLDDYHLNRSAKDGKQSRCKPCANTGLQQYKTPEHNRKYNLRRSFGITVEEYDALLERQGGVCAICGKAKYTYDKNGRNRAMHVDHDHTTGRIRGILCHDCNTGIGKLGDNPDTLRLAITYLERP